MLGNPAKVVMAVCMGAQGRQLISVNRPGMSRSLDLHQYAARSVARCWRRGRGDSEPVGSWFHPWTTHGSGVVPHLPLFASPNGDGGRFFCRCLDAIAATALDACQASIRPAA